MYFENWACLMKEIIKHQLFHWPCLLWESERELEDTKRMNSSNTSLYLQRLFHGQTSLEYATLLFQWTPPIKQRWSHLGLHWALTLFLSLQVFLCCVLGLFFYILLLPFSPLSAVLDWLTRSVDGTRRLPHEGVIRALSGAESLRECWEKQIGAA